MNTKPVLARLAVLVAFFLTAPSCEPRFVVSSMDLWSTQVTTGLEATLEQVDKQRADRTNFLFTYRVRLTNNGTDADSVAARVSSTSANTVVLDGEVTFEDLLSNQTVLSRDTLTIRHDRREPFDPSSLVWTFEVEPSMTGCSQLDPEDIALIVADMTQALISEGVNISGASWADPVQFELIITRLEEQLGCVLLEEDGLPIVSSGSLSLSPSAVTGMRPYIPTVNYCGPGIGGPQGGTTGVDGKNPPTRECVNRSCYRHDECYSDSCVRFGCVFSLAGGAAPCDAAFFGDLASCGISDPLSLLHPGSVIVAELATVFAALQSNLGTQLSCLVDSDRCSVGEECSREICDREDNDCNDFIDDTVNVSGTWAGSWNSLLTGSAGPVPRLRLEQAGTSLIGSGVLEGTALGTVVGQLSGTIQCEDAQLGGAVGNLFATGVQGEFSGTVDYCSGSGSYDVEVQNLALDSGRWEIGRECLSP